MIKIIILNARPFHVQEAQKKKSILTAKMSSGKSKLVSLLVNINQLLTTRPKIL